MCHGAGDGVLGVLEDIFYEGIVAEDLADEEGYARGEVFGDVEEVGDALGFGEGAGAGGGGEAEGCVAC